jgi:hypothetical protein
MNPSSELSSLMALDALGEATPEQQAELRRLLTEQPGLAAQHKALRDTALLADTAAAREAAPRPVPSHLLQRMEQARNAALSRAAAEKASESGAGNVVAFDAARGAQISSQKQPREVSAARRRPSTLFVLAWAAALVLVGIPLSRWLVPGGPAALATASPALAPRGETGMTQPTLVWENAPDQHYDVWILHDGANQKEAPALFVANKVRSPIEFAELKPGPANIEQTASLKPGSRYLALVCLAGKGRMAGVTVPFQTAAAAIGAPASPSDPATALSLARQMRDAGRPGDALMILAGLPEEIRRTPEVASLDSELRKSLQAAKVP